MFANSIAKSDASASNSRDSTSVGLVADSAVWKEPKFTLVSASKLTEEMKADWDYLRKSNSSLRSPFHSWQFIQDAGAIIPDVECLAVQRSGRFIAFFPFERRKGDIARPVGAGINDAQGVICAPEIELDFCQIAVAARLKQYSFHAASPDLPGLVDCQVGTRTAFLADLDASPGNFCAYLKQRSRTIAKQRQKTRRMERELGTLHFDFDCDANNLLERMLDLKSHQYRRTHTFDILSVRWVRQLLVLLHQVREERRSENSARGILSVLSAGELPLAMHFGIVEGDLLHYWFPVYNPEHAFGSPGTELYLRIVQTAEKLGIRYIDFGYGDLPYKHKLTNVKSEMCYGIYDSRPFRRSIYRAKRFLRGSGKEIRLRNMLKPIARRVFPSFGKGDF